MNESRMCIELLLNVVAEHRSATTDAPQLVIHLFAHFYVSFNSVAELQRLWILYMSTDLESPECRWECAVVRSMS